MYNKTLFKFQGVRKKTDNKRIRIKIGVGPEMRYQTVDGGTPDKYFYCGTFNKKYSVVHVSCTLFKF